MLQDRPTKQREGGDPLIPVFVYGTLRVGQYNFGVVRKAVRDIAENCIASGSIYFYGGRRGYPIAKFDEVGDILGDVLWCDPSHPGYDRMMRMELGAGYESREISVRKPDGDVIECIAFHYIGTPKGEWIQSGDWVKEWTANSAE
jgi:gamma-glutamylcyclotransferase (GGCT)/AIG2-like uncharacterized protein YtfP